MLAHLMAQLTDDEIRKAFGARLKALRKKHGLTQKEAAAHIGAQATHLNKYESGIHAPPLAKIALLAERYGVTLDYLILGHEPDEVTITNLHLLERFRALQEADKDDQDTVVRVIDAMIAKNRVANALRPVTP